MPTEAERRVTQLIDADNFNAASLARLARELAIAPIDLLRSVPSILPRDFDIEALAFQFFLGSLDPLQQTALTENLVFIRRVEEPISERLPETVEAMAAEVSELHEELGGFLDFITPRSLSLEDLLEKLSDLLLHPRVGPDEPCRAPAPLLRDLLDIALGRVTGGLDAIIGKVRSTVQDLLLPAAAKGDDLAHFVQSILDDPVTAALNLVLGMENQIDCEVAARKDVGESVIEAGFKRLVGFVDKVLA